MEDTLCLCGKKKKSSIGGIDLDDGQFLCGSCVVKRCNEYNGLLEEKRILNVLEEAGVNNWEGYKDALADV